jgi:hypothetical protein
MKVAVVARREAIQVFYLAIDARQIRPIAWRWRAPDKPHVSCDDGHYFRSEILVLGGRV